MDFLFQVSSRRRSKSHAIPRAAACRRSAQCLETSKDRGEPAHRQAARISARSRVISTAKFCGREKFRKFRALRSEIRSKSHRISRGVACQRSAQMLGTSEGREEAANHQAAWISARSHAISNESFCAPRKFFENFGREPGAVSRFTACRRSALMSGTS